MNSSPFRTTCSPHADRGLVAPVRVVVRIRPPCEPLVNPHFMHVVRPDRGLQHEWKWDDHSVYQAGENMDLVGTYENVFGPSSTNEDIYHSGAHELVRNTIDGYDACIYAFGQTNSGKTHTLHGCRTSPGVISQAAQDFFNEIENQTECVSLLRVSFLELYNEQIRDLLHREVLAYNSSDCLETDGQELLASRSTSKDLLFYPTIVKDPDRGTIVLHAREVLVRNVEDVMNLLDLGEHRRLVAPNDAHIDASRSHTIFRFIFESRNASDQSVRLSTLSIVDTAGNETPTNLTEESSEFAVEERERKSNIAQRWQEGERAKKLTTRVREGKNIRKSLLALESCVRVAAQSASKQSTHSQNSTALASPGRNSTRIPYRDSKLTRLLHHTIGGSAFTLVICTINPNEQKESLCTLHFGSNARKVSNYPSQVRVLSHNSLLAKYKDTIQRLVEEAELIHQAQVVESQQVEVGLQGLITKETCKYDKANEEARKMDRKIESLQSFLLYSAVTSSNSETRGRNDTTSRKKNYRARSVNCRSKKVEQQDNLNVEKTTSDEKLREKILRLRYSTSHASENNLPTLSSGNSSKHLNLRVLQKYQEYVALQRKITQLKLQKDFLQKNIHDEVSSVDNESDVTRWRKKTASKLRECMMRAIKLEKMREKSTLLTALWSCCGLSRTRTFSQGHKIEMLVRKKYPILQEAETIIKYS